MNARVFLLILVTAFFMAAWNGDEAAMQAAIARRTERQTQAIALLEGQNSDASAETGQQEPEIKTVSLIHQKTSSCTAAAEVPLPDGIAAGTYQAVNQTGKSIRIDVDKASSGQPRDFYMVDAKDGNRWYLIRVKQ